MKKQVIIKRGKCSQKIAANNEEYPVLWPRLIENTPEFVGVDQECCFSTFQLLLNHQDPFEHFFNKLTLITQSAATVA
jgi:hypothetical protein